MEVYALYLYMKTIEIVKNISLDIFLLFSLLMLFGSIILSILYNRFVFKNKARYSRAKKILCKSKFITEYNEKKFFAKSFIIPSCNLKKTLKTARTDGITLEKIDNAIYSEIISVSGVQKILNFLYIVYLLIAVVFLISKYERIGILTLVVVLSIPWLVALCCFSIGEKIKYIINQKYGDKLYQLIKSRTKFQKVDGFNVDNNNSLLSEVQLSNHSNIIENVVKREEDIRELFRKKETETEVNRAIDEIESNTKQENKLLSKLLEPPIIYKNENKKSYTKGLLGFDTVEELVMAANEYMKRNGDIELAKRIRNAIEELMQLEYSNPTSRIKLHLLSESLKKYVS